MFNPYTIEKLNAERLKDLDREAARLHLSRLARRNRKAAFKAIRRWLADFFIAAWDCLKHAVDRNTRLLNGSIQKHHSGLRRRIRTQRAL